MLTVLWHDVESANYTDLLPEDWLLEEGVFLERVHSVRGPRSGTYEAKCNVKVSGATADFDYEPFIEFNTQNKMYLGVMRIQFEGDNRERATQIFWKDKESKSFESCSTTIGREHSDEIAPMQDIDLPEIPTIEGRKKLVMHLKCERSPGLVSAKKAAVIAAGGTLACEACAFKFEDQYGELGKTYCEVHHLKPLAGNQLQVTTLDDLAILCSNCHRMIHRTSPMLSVEMFREKWLINGSSRPAGPTR